MEDKICPNCKTRNPIVANYCRHCRFEFNPNGVTRRSNESILHDELYNLQRVCEKLHQEEDGLKKEVLKHQTDAEKIAKERDAIMSELIFYKDALGNEKAINLKLNKELSSLKEQLSSTSKSRYTPPPHGGATYTPLAFPSIDFTPRSLFNPHFNILLWFFLTLLNVGGFVLLQVFSDDVEHEFGETVTIFFKIIILLISIRLYLKLLASIIHTFVFNNSADFVEKTPMNGMSGKFHRIGKKSKLGLFDAKRKKVCVKTKYDAIEVFDSNHLLLNASGWVGLYSIPQKKIIIPVKYNRIGPFRNNLADAIWSGGVEHYDMTGKLMR